MLQISKEGFATTVSTSLLEATKRTHASSGGQ